MISLRKINNLLLLILLTGGLSTSALAQNFTSKAVKVRFFSSTPIEDIRAASDKGVAVLISKTGKIAFQVPIKSFEFAKGLMQEHFNENYMESDKYPKGVFKGKIENFNIESLTSNNQDFTINGSMEIHGKSKDITITAKISKKENSIFLSSNFNLNTDDFGIELPILVRSKVAKKVNVQIDYSLK